MPGTWIDFTLSASPSCPLRGWLPWTSHCTLMGPSPSALPCLLSCEPRSRSRLKVRPRTHTQTEAHTLCTCMRLFVAFVPTQAPSISRMKSWRWSLRSSGSAPSPSSLMKSFLPLEVHQKCTSRPWWKDCESRNRYKYLIQLLPLEINRPTWKTICFQKYAFCLNARNI